METSSHVFKSDAFSENLLNKLNDMRLSPEANWCDLVIECKDGEKINCHACIVGSQCDLQKDNDNLIKIDLHKDAVAAIVNFCYTGVLTMNVENVVGLLNAAEALHLQRDVTKVAEAYFVEQLSEVVKNKAVIEDLSEGVIRKALEDPRREQKMIYWTKLLLAWLMSAPQGQPRTARQPAFFEFMTIICETESSDAEVPTSSGMSSPAPLDTPTLTATLDSSNFTFGSLPQREFSFGSPFGTVPATTPTSSTARTGVPSMFPTPAAGDAKLPTFSFAATPTNAASTGGVFMFSPAPSTSTASAVAEKRTHAHAKKSS